MPKINLDGKFPCMSNWVTLRRSGSSIIARNVAIDEEVELTEREAIYLKSLNGNRDKYKINGFSRDECREYYRCLNECLLIRGPGRNINLNGIYIHTVYIPNKKSTNSIIPKILNFLLLISFFPVLFYGIYLFISYGVNWCEDENFFLNMVLGCGLGIGGGIICHEIAHAIACLSYNGKFFEAGVMVRGITPGAYVLIDESEIESRLKRAQINMAGIEMNILLAGVMMMLMAKVKVGSCLFEYKTAMFYIMIQNVFGALVNISFVEGMDGEHTISSLIGAPIVDVAKANIRQMTTRKKRKEYFSKAGINGVANICTSILIMGFQIIIPMLILADISILIGGIFL